MNISTLLNDLFARGVTLWPDGTDLGLRGAKELLTPGLLSTLKAHKGEILQALAHGSETFPLTHGQWAFWYEEQLATGRGGERTTYHVSLALRIHAPLNPAAMQRALQMLVNRHPMLRTTFADIDGKLAQLVHQYQEVTFTTVDMRDEAWTAVHKQLQEAHAQPFDLELGPLFRTKLFHCAANDYVLICSAHHIVCDGLSLWLIMDELPVLYTIAATGHGKPPLPHSAHYADYVTWQRDLLAEKGDELLAFWRQQLAHAPTLLTLPTDFPRPAMRTYAGASQPLALSPQLTRQLRDVARAEGVTLYMLLLAAYQLLLRCYTGQIDILVESRMSGRAKAEFYTLVGNFFSPVVLRAHMPGNLTLREFLRQVRQTTVASLKHQDYTFSRLVEQLP
ncbi:MAG: hypothetical protein KDE47_14650, partial [Caldilineaceae bacterium]|nr:hypothetical protein [Caldilineaceae bacterium]